MLKYAVLAHAAWAALVLLELVWTEYAPHGRLRDALAEWSFEVRQNALRSNETPMFPDYRAAQEIADDRLERYAAARLERMERLRRRIDEGRVERIEARRETSRKVVNR